MSSDVAVIAVLLVVAGAAMALLRRRPTPRVLAWSAVTLFGAWAVLPAALGDGGFGIVRLAAHGLVVPCVAFPLAAALVVRRERPRLALGAAVFGLACAAILIDAFLVEPRWIEVSRHRLETDRVEKRLRIVVLADVQADAIGSHERRAIRRALEEAPDLLLLPGDFVQAEPERRDRVLADLRDAFLEAFEESERDGGTGGGPSLGAVAVAGNVDRGDWTESFEGVPVRTIAATTRLDLGPITLTALSLRDSFDADLRVPPADGFHVVVGHAPDFALGDVAADLLVAGHCHGGQVRLPFLGPIVTLSEVPRSWAAGRTELPGGGTLVVSRGIGMERGEAPRLRFLCRPEIVVIEVVPEE